MMNHRVFLVFWCLFVASSFAMLQHHDEKDARFIRMQKMLSTELVLAGVSSETNNGESCVDIVNEQFYCEELALLAKKYGVKPDWGIEGAVACRFMNAKRALELRENINAVCDDQIMSTEGQAAEESKGNLELRKALREKNEKEALRYLGEGCQLTGEMLRDLAIRCYDPWYRMEVSLSVKEKLQMSVPYKRMAVLIMDYYKQLDKELVEIQWLLKQLDQQYPIIFQGPKHQIKNYLGDYFKELRMPMNGLLRKSEAFKWHPIISFYPKDLTLKEKLLYCALFRAACVLKETMFSSSKPFIVMTIVTLLLGHYVSSTKALWVGLLLPAIFYPCLGWKKDVRFLSFITETSICIKMLSLVSGWNTSYCFKILMSKIFYDFAIRSDDLLINSVESLEHLYRAAIPIFFLYRLAEIYQ